MKRSLAIGFVLLASVYGYAMAADHGQAMVYACFPKDAEPYFVEFSQTVIVLHQKIDSTPWDDPQDDAEKDYVGGVIFTDTEGKQHVAYAKNRDRCIKAGYKTEV